MIKQYPPFSVLMSVYAKDNPTWIAQALDSVLNQTCPPDEIVVVIDGPVPPQITSVLMDYSTRFAQIKLYPLERNEGLGVALQKGLLLCAHPLVARMDSDDLSCPDRFEKQLCAFAADAQMDILGGGIEEFDAQPQLPTSRRLVPLSSAQIRRYLKTRCPFNHVTVMFKKAAILSVGNYQPFHFLEDYYLWIRCASGGLKMANLSDILVNVRVNAGMYGRRGGYTYFCNNKALYGEMLHLGLINLREYVYVLGIRFIVQVFMPNGLRSWFYKRVLR